MWFLSYFLFLSILFIFKDKILSCIFKKAYNLKLKNSSPFFLVNFFFSVPLASFETWDIRFHWLDLEVFSRDINVSDHNFGLFNSDIYHECHSIVPYTSSDAELMRSWLIYSDSVFVSFYSNFFKQNLIDSLETLNEADFIYWSNYFELFSGGASNSSFASFFDLSVSEIFYIFFTVSALLSTLFLFMTHNPVNSILHLVLVFLNVAFLILLLEVEYIALTFMIVYIGAISMLFVFVIMMLDIRKESLIFFDSKLRSWYKLFGFFLFLFILFEFYLLLFDSFNIIGGDKDLLLFSTDTNSGANNNFMFEAAGNISENWSADNPGKKQLFFRLGLDNVGHFLYTYYFVYLYIVGFILLVPMLGAIVLTNRSKIVCFFGVPRLLNIVYNFSFFFIYFYFCYNKIILFFSIFFNYIKKNMFAFYFTLVPFLRFTFTDFFDFYNGDVLFGDDFCSFFFGYTEFDPSYGRCSESFYRFSDFGTYIPAGMPHSYDLLLDFCLPSIFSENPSKTLLESVSVGYLLIPGVLLFVFGFFSLAFVRKHILIYLMAIEIMLLGISLMLVIFSLYWLDPCGDILVLLILCVAAAEVVIALAIAVAIYRNENNESIAIESIANLRF